jgi:hypothetical protein
LSASSGPAWNSFGRSAPKRHSSWTRALGCCESTTCLKGMAMPVRCSNSSGVYQPRQTATHHDAGAGPSHPERLLTRVLQEVDPSLGNGGYPRTPGRVSHHPAHGPWRTRRPRRGSRSPYNHPPAGCASREPFLP